MLDPLEARDKVEFEPQNVGGALTVTAIERRTDRRSGVRDKGDAIDLGQNANCASCDPFPKKFTNA